MLKIFAAVFVLITGVIATDICDKSFHLICPEDNIPKKFPETKEELRNSCDSAIDFFQCGAKHLENCNKNHDEIDALLRIFQEVCDEDTLLYATIADNLKCFNELIEEERNRHECVTSRDSPSVARYIESLAEQGLLTLTDDELESHNIRICIRSLQDLACIATKTERKCGTVAMDTYIEILNKFGPMMFECGESFNLLPAVIRLYKLEEEEANEIEAIFKRRK